MEDLKSENRLRRGILEDQGGPEMMLCRKREASSCLKAQNWEDVEEGGGASWSVGQGTHLVMANLLWSYLMAESSGCYLSFLLLWLRGLETVWNVYWEQGKHFRLGWIELHSPCPEVLCPGTQGCLLVSLS